MRQQELPALISSKAQSKNDGGGGLEGASANLSRGSGECRPVAHFSPRTEEALLRVKIEHFNQIFLSLGFSSSLTLCALKLMDFTENRSFSRVWGKEKQIQELSEGRATVLLGCFHANGDQNSGFLLKVMKILWLF